MDQLTRGTENLIFRSRSLTVALFLAFTGFMAYSASQIGIDAGFSKLLPLHHEYMQTFTKHREEFGGANRVLIALIARDGDMFTPEFFESLKSATDKVFFIPGVDRSQVRSLFTPNVRYTEVVEDGIAGGNVVPAYFEPTPEGLATVRENILKAGIVGRLVANDFSGALISVQLLEFDPTTGEPLDYVFVARELEEVIRGATADGGIAIEIDTHIIGFAKVIGDISDVATRVILFFGIAVLMTAVLLYLYSHSLMLTLVTLACSLVAVVWQLGLLTLMGYGIDPLGIVVPFLIFAIAVSHGVQMVNAFRHEVTRGATALDSARTGCRLILLPSLLALISDTIGFVTILMIRIQVIREMAITASLGVAAIILTNLILLPVLLSYLPIGERFRERLSRRVNLTMRLWDCLAWVPKRKPAAWILAASALLLVAGAWKSTDIRIGDAHRGVPELRPDSRYNEDSHIISSRFSIGVDVLNVIAETVDEGCIDHEVMTAIDRFGWHMENAEGVQSVVSLAAIAKRINAGWNEGGLKWRVLPRNQSVLAQAVAYVPTSSGLLNEDCSVMPVMVFTTDHKAETITGIVSAVQEYTSSHASEKVRFLLATGNVGVMAATHGEVRGDQFPILFGVFSAIILLCLVTYRSVRAVLCIIIPLGLVSLLAYALMAVLEIGLKVSTLPVVALGVGIGVDYGIYIYSRMRVLMGRGATLPEAYHHTLQVTGSGVIFTGLTLAAGVATWIFSPLQFQVDMGILLTFMFLVNMLGAIFLLPALAYWLLPSSRDAGSTP
jgi:predicted RND superfamily exporter protein